MPQITWISVDEQLPKDREDVLVYNPHRPLSPMYTAYIARDRSGQQWFSCGNHNVSVLSGDITHWAALPESPKGDT